MNNIHGARINRDTLTPSGLGFVGSSHSSRFPSSPMISGHRSSVLARGPDGSVFMIDWYDKESFSAITTM